MKKHCELMIACSNNKIHSGREHVKHRAVCLLVDLGNVLGKTWVLLSPSHSSLSFSRALFHTSLSPSPSSPLLWLWQQCLSLSLWLMYSAEDGGHLHEWLDCVAVNVLHCRCFSSGSSLLKITWKDVEVALLWADTGCVVLSGVGSTTPSLS